jgi:hypothetical protein
MEMRRARLKAVNSHSVRWPALLLLGLLWAVLAVSAEDEGASARTVQVTTCQLETRPDAYDRKLVEVRGRIYFGKFDFVIDSDCKEHRQARIWLDLGGDVEAPGRYWGVVSFLPKQKGQDVRVRGISIPLVRDAMLDQFVNDVGATRFRKPNGDDCGSECLFYEVTATVRGRFFSATKGGGFGMEECCHLLVIEKVISVSSRRDLVPAGGEFHCTSDRWQPTADELKALSAIPGCSLRDDFKMCSVVFAKHWGDTINAKEGLDYPGPWMSPDMMLSYRFTGNFVQSPGQNPGHRGPGKVFQMKPASVVTREACRAVSPPRPASDHVSCNFYRSGLLEGWNGAALRPDNDAYGESWKLTDATQVGWLAFQDSARQWDLDPDTPLRSVGCERDTMAESKQPWAQCTWLARDGLEQVVVNLRKPINLKNAAGDFDKVPWLATDVEASQCRTEPKRN